MFEIAKQQVKLIKASVPIENHGKEKKAAIVLTVEAVLSNVHLNLLAHGLTEALYRKAEDQDQSDLISETALRFPKMSPFDWDYTGTGYKAVIDYGLGGDSDIALTDVKIDSFSITPMEGGTVVYRFNIIGHTDELYTGRLCFLQKQDIDLTLKPPAPTKPEDLFKDAA